MRRNHGRMSSCDGCNVSDCQSCPVFLDILRENNLDEDLKELAFRKEDPRKDTCHVPDGG